MPPILRRAKKDPLVSIGERTGLKRKYGLPDGRTIFIELDDDLELIEILDANRQLIGKIELRLIDEDDEQRNHYLLSWAYLDLAGDSYKRCGIGRTALQLHQELAEYPIVARDNDGIRQDDGSHLTGDAPGFVEQMRKEGLIKEG